jgi:diguanylate cyclase (GGDEF)-like protein
MHVDDKGTNLCKDYCPLEKTLQDGQAREVSVFLRHKQGHRVPVHVRSVPLRDDAGFINCTMEVFTRGGLAGSYDQLKALARKAFVDSLTGLPNRDYIETKLTSLLSSGVPGDINQWGILLIDIDNLRDIGNEFGLSASQTAIKVAALTLRENLEPGELAARVDGGLFMVITNMDKRSILLNWAAKIKALIEQSQITGFDTAKMEVCVGGVIAGVGEISSIVLSNIEKELKNCRESVGNISIRDD